MLRLFVYGTLKRGYWNHETYCSSAVSIEVATVVGRLYELPSAIPILMIPDTSILAVGSSHVSDDVARQGSLGLRDSGGNEDCWDEVQVELITFADADAIADIDRLEGFRSGELSLYRRVLVLVKTASGARPAWCYVQGIPSMRAVTLLSKNSWP